MFMSTTSFFREPRMATSGSTIPASISVFITFSCSVVFRTINCSTITDAIHNFRLRKQNIIVKTLKSIKITNIFWNILVSRAESVHQLGNDIRINEQIDSWGLTVSQNISSSFDCLTSTNWSFSSSLYKHLRLQKYRSKLRVGKMKFECVIITFDNVYDFPLHHFTSYWVTAVRSVS